MRRPARDHVYGKETVSRIERVREVRGRLMTAGTVVAPDGRSHELSPVSIGATEGRALRGWVHKEGALQTLETGLGYAISTLFICEGLLANGSSGRHVAADPYQFNTLRPGTTYAGVGLQTLEDAGVRDLVEFYEEESQIVLPRLLGEGRRFDLDFIDGNHRFEGVFLDLIYTGRLLKESGIVFVDDTQLQGVRRAVDFCVANLGWVAEEAGEEGIHREWLVLRTGSPAVFHRPFMEFVDL